MASTLSGRPFARLIRKMSFPGATSTNDRAEMVKLSIRFAVLFVLSAVFLLFTLHLLGVSKGFGVPNFKYRYGCHTEECEVKWFPPRVWTQPSKYSPVAGSQHELQMYGTLAAQKAIWTHQHPSSCHDKKFLVYEAQGTDHGIGSVIHVTVIALLAALNMNRILVLAPQPNFEWVQGKFCEGTDTMDECYFEPLSSCTIHDVFGSDLEVTNENFLRFAELNMGTYANNNERVLRTQVRSLGSGLLPFATRTTPVMFHKMLERGKLSTEFYYWWRAQGSAYIVRPTLRTLRELDRRRASGIFQGQPIEPGTISVHVRHGDKWKETQLQPDAAFLRSAEALVAHDSNVLGRRIFLSTEDPDTVTFFAQLSNWTVQYTNVSRVQDPTVGPEDFAKKIGWDEEFLNSLLSLQLALECDGFVGDIESNWNRLIDELRSTARSKFHRHFVDVVQGFDIQNYSW